MTGAWPEHRGKGGGPDYRAPRPVAGERLDYQAMRAARVEGELAARRLRIRARLIALVLALAALAALGFLLNGIVGR